MSNNLTRKGLAFGTSVAFASTLFALPATAVEPGQLSLELENTTTNGSLHVLYGDSVSFDVTRDSNVDDENLRYLRYKAVATVADADDSVEVNADITYVSYDADDDQLDTLTSEDALELNTVTAANNGETANTDVADITPWHAQGIDGDNVDNDPAGADIDYSGPYSLTGSGNPTVDIVVSGTDEGDDYTTLDGSTSVTVYAWVDSNSNGVIDDGESQSEGTTITWHSLESLTYTLALDDVWEDDTTGSFTATVTPLLNEEYASFNNLDSLVDAYRHNDGDYGNRVDLDFAMDAEDGLVATDTAGDAGMLPALDSNDREFIKLHLDADDSNPEAPASATLVASERFDFQSQDVVYLSSTVSNPASLPLNWAEDEYSGSADTEEFTYTVYFHDRNGDGVEGVEVSTSIAVSDLEAEEMFVVNGVELDNGTLTNTDGEDVDAFEATTDASGAISFTIDPSSVEWTGSVRDLDFTFTAQGITWDEEDFFADLDNSGTLETSNEDSVDETHQYLRTGSDEFDFVANGNMFFALASDAEDTSVTISHTAGTDLSVDLQFTMDNMQTTDTRFRVSFTEEDTSRGYEDTDEYEFVDGRATAVIVDPDEDASEGVMTLYGDLEVREGGTWTALEEDAFTLNIEYIDDAAAADLDGISVTDANDTDRALAAGANAPVFYGFLAEASQQELSIETFNDLAKFLFANDGSGNDASNEDSEYSPESNAAATGVLWPEEDVNSVEEAAAVITGTVENDEGFGLEGHEVTFSASAGSGLWFMDWNSDDQQGSSTGNDELYSISEGTNSVVTDNNGDFEMSVLGTVAGEHTVTITSGGVTSTTTVVIDAAPDNRGDSLIELTNVNGAASEAMDVFATLVDMYGNPVEGATVNFSALGGKGYVNPSTGETDEDGVAGTKFVVQGNEVGNAQITVSYDNWAGTSITTTDAVNQVGYGDLKAWTVRISDTLAKVYVKYPELGEKLRISHQTGGSGSYETIFVKTISSENDSNLVVNENGKYIVRNIDLADGTNRIRVTSGDTTEVQVRYNR